MLRNNFIQQYQADSYTFCIELQTVINRCIFTNFISNDVKSAIGLIGISDHPNFTNTYRDQKTSSKVRMKRRCFKNFNSQIF